MIRSNRNPVDASNPSYSGGRRPSFRSARDAELGDDMHATGERVCVDKPPDHLGRLQFIHSHTPGCRFRSKTRLAMCPSNYATLAPGKPPFATVCGGSSPVAPHVNG